MEFKDSFAMKEFKQYGVYGTYKKHFFGFIDHAGKLAGLEDENERLNQKVALLEKDVTLSEGARTERDLAALNKTLEEKLDHEAGSTLAVTEENIDYEVPKKISPAGLYTLALGYFRKKDFEKVVVLLDHLMTLKEDQQYVRGENYLMSGIAWYHLKNYKVATQQINQAKKYSDGASKTHRSAVLWEALVSQAQGEAKVTQGKLLKFVELYPHSEEAMLINGNRKPASHSEREYPEHSQNRSVNSEKTKEGHAGSGSEHQHEAEAKKEEAHHE